MCFVRRKAWSALIGRLLNTQVPVVDWRQDDNVDALRIVVEQVGGDLRGERSLAGPARTGSPGARRRRAAGFGRVKSKSCLSIGDRPFW